MKDEGLLERNFYLEGSLATLFFLIVWIQPVSDENILGLAALAFLVTLIRAAMAWTRWNDALTNR